MTITVTVVDYYANQPSTITATITNNPAAVVGGDVTWTSANNAVVPINALTSKITDVGGVLTTEITFTSTTTGTSNVTAGIGNDVSTPVTATVANSNVFSYEIVSNSNEWCTTWQNIRKEIYVHLIGFDPNNSEHVGFLDDTYVTIIKDERRAPGGDTGAIIPEPRLPVQFNQYGVATVEVLFVGIEGDFTFVSAQLADGATLQLGPQQGEFRVELEAASLPVAVVPAANDGAITDEDVLNGVWVTLQSPISLKPGDGIEIYFGLHHTVVEVTEPMPSYRFQLPEAFMDNGVHELFYSIYDGSSNMSFSRMKLIRVDRQDISEEGYNDYPIVLITEGEAKGVINKADTISGISVEIPQDVTDALKAENVESANMIFTGYTKLNVPIRGVITVQNIMTKYDDDVQGGAFVEPWKWYGIPAYDFFNKIGEGVVGVKFNIKLIDDVHYHTSKYENKYRVDVLPPRR